MTRCRIPNFFERYKIDNGIYDPKLKLIFPRFVKRRDNCVNIHNNHFCVFWKKNRRNSLINGVHEKNRMFKYVIKIHESNLKQKIRYRIPNHETIDELENEFVLDLETYNDLEFAEAYAAGLNDVNCLQDKWDRDLTDQEIETEGENVTVFDGSNGNPVMNMLKYISDNYDGDERTYIDRDGNETVSSYRLFLVAHSSSRFDSWVVLISLAKKIKELKIIKLLGD